MLRIGLLSIALLGVTLRRKERLGRWHELLLLLASVGVGRPGRRMLVVWKIGTSVWSEHLLVVFVLGVGRRRAVHDVAKL